ncbi:MAG: hypothetical protein CVV49_08105 [Spirochaetae bacterium HGW-Spirochaetae-5]|nr:MAG: hypothetical protein CVV49_08105 [Spirochaetae bacterium HGW-Spirochaetae-5]
MIFKISGNILTFIFFQRLIIISAIIILHNSSAYLYAETKLTLLLTSNLQGRFSDETLSQDKSDPMLLLAQSLIKEKDSGGFDVFLDLGNAFYPGALSRYSYGSVMMDFFTYFDCGATLVSSRDISIGLSNLKFLSDGKKTKLLSANITRDNQPVFTPYIILNHSKKKIGIIGVSSADGLFDIADKKVLNISFREYRESIKERAEELKGEGCDNIILLSGLSYRNNIELMQSIPDVNLIISGGDSTGSFFSVPASRVDLQWGRSVIALLQNDGYYRLELELGEGIEVKSMNFNKPAEYKTSDQSYLEFRNRLTLWKEKFKEESSRIITDNIPDTTVTDQTAADMLRHRYRTEIGIIEKNSIQPQVLSGMLYYSTIMTLVNNDYPVFTYRLSGADLKKIEADNSELVITGLKNSRVQNYNISDTRTYSVSSTQYAYDRITRILRKHIEYSNTWMTLQDEIEDDLKTEKSLISADFTYLDERFRMLIDISLSNFYDRSVVERGDSIATPPGKPAKTYRRWGMEDTVNITLYNINHNLILTPYIYYIKQDELYLQNLFRGTLLYSYNLNEYLKPYHKSQFDTVLVEVDGRPVLIRETAGFSLTTEMVTGKLGVGFEQQIHDPKNPKLYGVETLLTAIIPFNEEFSYSLKFDSFISFKNRSSEELKARTEVTNSFSYKVNSFLGVSLKYKWFYLYTGDIEEYYRYSQTLVSIDLKTDFKLK